MGQVQSLATLSLYEQRLQRQYEKAQQHFRDLEWRRECAERDAQRKAEAKAREEAKARKKEEDDDRLPPDEGSGPAASAPEPVSQPAEEATPSPENGFVCSPPPAPRKSLPAKALAYPAARVSKRSPQP